MTGYPVPGEAPGSGPSGGRKPATAKAEADPFTRAREICLVQLTARARSRAELASTLRRRGIEPDVAEAVLDRLAEVGLIDDGAYASAVVATGRTVRGLGRRALAADLRRRGVEPDLRTAALAAVAPEDEEATARELVRRRLRSLARLSPEVRARRLAAMLTRKGYPQGLIMRVVTDAMRDSVDGETIVDALGDGEVDEGFDNEE